LVPVRRQHSLAFDMLRVVKSPTGILLRCLEKA
jgi:hypothetical protein